MLDEHGNYGVATFRILLFQSGLTLAYLMYDHSPCTVIGLGFESYY